MDTLILLCTIVVCTVVGIGLGGLFLLGFLGLVSRVVASDS